MKTQISFLLCFIWACVSLAAQSHADNWAILIGIDDYQNAPDLKFAGADQQSLGKHLVKAGFDERQVVIMHSKSENKNLIPTRENILRQLKINLNIVNKGDFVLIGFSGHGAHVDAKDYLFPADADPKEPKTLIALDEIYKQLNASAATSKTMLVDAKNINLYQKSLTAKKEQFLKNGDQIPAGVMFLNSCAPGQTSFDDEKLGHGVWMHFVLQGLRGKADKDKNGRVTLADLATYASRETSLHVRDQFNGLQRPWTKLSNNTDSPGFKTVGLDYQPRIAMDKGTKGSNQQSQSPSKKPKVALDEAFKAALDLAMKAEGIDGKIKMLGELIEDKTYKVPERNVARSLRIRLQLLRNKEGDVKNAISDARAMGRAGIPVTVKQETLTLAYAKDGEPIRTQVEKGAILNISTLDSDSFWVSSVDGDKSKRGWVRKSRLFNLRRSLEISDKFYDNSNEGMARSFFPTDNEFDDLDGQLKAYEQELKQVEKVLNNPFNGLSDQERAAMRRELEQMKRQKILNGERRDLGTFGNIFEGGQNGGGGGIFGGGKKDGGKKGGGKKDK